LAAFAALEGVGHCHAGAGGTLTAEDPLPVPGAGYSAIGWLGPAI
jgi:hypothetical protein